MKVNFYIFHLVKKNIYEYSYYIYLIFKFLKVVSNKKKIRIQKPSKYRYRAMGICRYAPQYTIEIIFYLEFGNNVNAIIIEAYEKRF